MVQENFFPCLFFGNSKYISPIVGTLSTMPVNKSGMGILNPVTSANNKELSLKHASTEFIQAVMGVGIFSNANHLLEFR